MKRLFGLQPVAQARKSGPWIMRQRWHDLLFAHWPVPTEALREVVPAGLELDLFEGQAWLGIVAFRLSGIKLRGLPEIPPLASFPEVNVRTYVRYGGRRGVYFLTLDADNPLAIAMARPWFRLNYYNAEVSFDARTDAVRMRSRRLERGVPEARLDLEYSRGGRRLVCAPASLDRWLTERYCYFIEHGGRIGRCDIEHGEWRLESASAAFAENTMASAAGVALPQVSPLLHYAPYMEAHVWRLRMYTGQPARSTRPRATWDRRALSGATLLPEIFHSK